jgi:hypothetical protein
MTKTIRIISSSLICLALLFSGVCRAQEQWILLNEDESGNRLYIDEASSQAGPGSQLLTVTMRFDLKKSETKMFFVDEIDCGKSLVRRLSLKMLNPVCTGDQETYATTFEGRWDVISEGIERKLFEHVCR